MDTKKLRQKILDLAIHGKLVPQDPNDEPASVLLERIKDEKERLIQEGKIKRSKKSAPSGTPHYAKDVPFEVPQGWVWCKLDDLAFYKKGPFGSSLTKSMFVPQSDNTYKIYEQKNAIQKDNTIGSYFITKEKYESLIGFTVRPYDIIVSCAGTIGETYVLPPNSQEGIINQALMLIRLYSREIERFYLLYFDFILKEEAHKESKGTAIKNIPPFDVLKNFYIPLPPLNEQKRILNEIDKWMSFVSSIENNRIELQTIIKHAKSKILDLAIHGKLVPQNPNDEPASEQLKRINPEAKITCDNAHSRKLPINWISCKLSDICIFLSRGKSPQYSNVRKYPVFAQKCNLKDGSISIEKARFLNPDTLNKWQDIYQLQENDIVINSTGTGTVGRVGLFKSSCLGSFPLIVPDSHISVVRTFEEINSMYIYTLLKTQACQTYFEDNLAGSTNQKELYISVIANTEISLPPVKEQKRIVAKIEELFNNLDHIETALQA